MFKERILLVAIVALWYSILNLNFVFAYQSVDPILEPYVFDYYEIFKERCPNKAKEAGNMYSIQFVDKNDDWIGVCMFRFNGYKIYINKNWWDNTAIEQDRRQLMYHELAHCVIDKMHVNDPNNYMYPSIQPLYYEDYIKQVESDIDAYCAK